jgi:hypothetical protein
VDNQNLNNNNNNQPQPSAPETPRPGVTDEPSLTPPPVSTTTPPPAFSAKPPQKKRKGLLIGIIAAIVVVLGGGGVAAYMWYQNPEKVVTDSVVNAIKAKTIKYTGSITVTGDSKMKIEVTGANTSSTSDLNGKVTFTMEDKEYTLESDVRFDKNSDLYLKVKNIDGLVKAYREAIPPQSQGAFDKLVAKINDQWIKISADDLAVFSEEASKQQKCVSEAIKKFQNDQTAINEVADVYKKNKFIKVDQNLGNKDWSLGYTLTGDEKAAESFMKGLKDTKLYKSLHDCDPASFTVDEKEQSKEITKDDKNDTRVELWVDFWSHKITKVNMTNKEKDTKNETSVIFQPKFDEKVEVATPDKSITLKQLQADIEEIITSSLPSSDELTAEEAALFASPETSSEL